MIRSLNFTTVVGASGNLRQLKSLIRNIGLDRYIRGSLNVVSINNRYHRVTISYRDSSEFRVLEGLPKEGVIYHPDFGPPVILFALSSIISPSTIQGIVFDYDNATDISADYVDVLSNRILRLKLTQALGSSAHAQGTHTIKYKGKIRSEDGQIISNFIPYTFNVSNTEIPPNMGDTRFWGIDSLFKDLAIDRIIIPRNERAENVINRLQKSLELEPEDFFDIKIIRNTIASSPVAAWLYVVYPLKKFGPYKILPGNGATITDRENLKVKLTFTKELTEETINVLSSYIQFSRNDGLTFDNASSVTRLTTRTVDITPPANALTRGVHFLKIVGSSSILSRDGENIPFDVYCAGLYNNTGTTTGVTAAGAPSDASYVTMAANGTLTAERVLTQGESLKIVDNGANSSVVVNVLHTGISQFTGHTAPALSGHLTPKFYVDTISGAITTGYTTDINNLSGTINSDLYTPSYVVISSSNSLINERSITVGTALSLSDDGAGGNLNIDVLPTGISQSTAHIAPTLGAHLTTKNYVDTISGAVTTGYSVLISNVSGSITTDYTNAISSTSGTLNTYIDSVSGALSAPHYITARSEPALQSEKVLTQGDSLSIINSGGTIIVGVLPTGISKFPGHTSPTVAGHLTTKDYTDNISGALTTAYTTAISNLSGVINTDLYTPSYIALAASDALINERVIVNGIAISFSDDGAGGNFTIDVLPTGVSKSTTHTAPTAAAHLATKNYVDNISGATSTGYSVAITNVSGAITTNYTNSITNVSGALNTEISNVSGALSSPTYLTISAAGSLSAERIVTQGTAISFTDAGANSTFHINVLPTGVSKSTTHTVPTAATHLATKDYVDTISGAVTTGLINYTRSPPFTLEFSAKNATPPGIAVTGFLTIQDVEPALRVQAGKTLQVLTAKLAFKSGPTEGGDYIVDAVIFNANFSAFAGVSCQATTDVPDTWAYAETGWDGITPLQTLAAGTRFAIGYYADPGNPDNLASANHHVLLVCREV
jgi:hypothetical protein